MVRPHCFWRSCLYEGLCRYACMPLQICAGHLVGCTADYNTSAEGNSPLQVLET